MKPIYAENIVVAIKQSGCIEWYILDKDYCFLDFTKLEDAYRKKGYDVVVDDMPRFGIKVVNEFSQITFLDEIKKYKITTKELKKMLMNELNINYGAIYENVVAQELKCHGFNLFYYNNNRSGELDFIIEYEDCVLPIEIKS